MRTLKPFVFLLVGGMLFCDSASAGTPLTLVIDKNTKEVYFDPDSTGNVVGETEIGGDYFFSWSGGNTDGTSQSFTLANNCVSTNSGYDDFISYCTIEVYSGATNGLAVVFNTGKVGGTGLEFNVYGEGVHSSYASLGSEYQAILENYTSTLPSNNGGEYDLYIQTIPEPAMITLLTACGVALLRRKLKK